MSIADPPEAMVARAVETAHSRFPVTGEDRDDVIGILLAKDLLRLHAGARSPCATCCGRRCSSRTPSVSTCCCASSAPRATTWPSSSTSTAASAGLVTIEDVLEQIVGDIEDEYDFDEAADNILLDQAGHYRVKAATEIADFNAAFATRFADEDYDTVGGMVIHHLGRLPKRGEVVQVDGLRIQVLRADSRRVHTLLVDRPQAAA
jgi:magnesium and cobalt transporter